MPAEKKYIPGYTQRHCSNGICDTTSGFVIGFLLAKVNRIYIWSGVRCRPFGWHCFCQINFKSEDYLVERPETFCQLVLVLYRKNSIVWEFWHTPVENISDS
jgi:hypothetical protein